jgi:hypothetical protein
LYINNNDHNIIVSENGNANIKNYVCCCNTLNRSLQKHGYYLTVLTNRPEEILKYNYDIKVEEVTFTLSVPDDVRFYSAHYKIDVFSYLSKFAEGYSILLDNDIICINEIPENFERIISRNIPVYYDITDQVYPAYGRIKIINGKQLIMEDDSIGNWAGGEFIGGDKIFWNDLYNDCIGFWENYQRNYKKLHHQGDEMLISCAIEKRMKENKCIFNIGTVGGVSRFWSVKTLHIGKPIEALYDNFLLHLPADKGFLSNYSYVDNDGFRKDYGKYLKYGKSRLSKQIIVKIKKIVKKLVKRKNGA